MQLDGKRTFQKHWRQNGNVEKTTYCFINGLKSNQILIKANHNLNGVISTNVITKLLLICRRIYEENKMSQVSPAYDKAKLCHRQISKICGSKITPNLDTLSLIEINLSREENDIQVFLQTVRTYRKIFFGLFLQDVNIVIKCILFQNSISILSFFVLLSYQKKTSSIS